MRKLFCCLFVLLSFTGYAQTISTTGNPNNFLPTDDKITLESTSTIFPSRYSWQWGYYNIKAGIITWTLFPSAFLYKRTIQIDAKDLFGADNVIYRHGSKIPISLGSPPTTVWSANTINLEVRISAPHIISVTPIQPICYGANNGSARVQFDRALYPGEELSITLFNTDKMIPVAGKNNIEAFDAGNTVTLDANLEPANYQIGLLGKSPVSSSYPEYSEAATHKATFSIFSPFNINFYDPIKINDVRCFGGNDGAIFARVFGSSTNYKLGYKNEKQSDFTWVNFPITRPFFSTALTLSNLEAGTYTLKVVDANGCYPKDMSNKELTKTIVIGQPAEPLHLDFSEITDPLAYGRTDGKIKAIIKGGTPKAGGLYTLSWKKLDGTILTSVTNTVVATGYQTELSNLAAGKYILNVTDSNFSIAGSGATQGCMIQDTFTVNQPPPLTVDVNQLQSISCKGDGNGVLIAHGNGGVSFTTGNPYKYQWFKREATDIDISKSDSIASGLIAGNYFVKITDKNGIEKISAVFNLTEPDSLKISFTTSLSICTSTGNIQATITGGTAPYRIAWTTGDTTTTINNQPEGDYLAYVTDAHGCETMSSIHLAIPGGIKIDTAIIQEPSYYNSNNGAIQLTVSGGNPPYTYQWNNGAITKDAQNLIAGDYNVIITDRNGCTKIQSYSLKKPLRIMKLMGVPLPVNVTTKTICSNQIFSLDATISDGAAQYQWNSDNGFTANTAKVDLTNAGTYWVKVTDSRGVTGSDTITITKSNAVLDANFMSTTQAFKGEKVVFINVSYPVKPEHITWIIPNDPKISIQQNDENLAELIFADTGTYYISMKATTGECEQIITRKVIVLEPQSFDNMGEIKDPFIKEFTIAPNPSTGNFNVKIILQEQSKIRLRIVSVSNNNTVDNRDLSGSSQYLIPYNITVAPGVYFLLLETPQGGVKGSRVRKIVIN